MTRNIKHLTTLIIGFACMLFSATQASAQNTSPLCFTARNGSVTVRFNIQNVTHTIQYSTNGTSWSTYTSGTGITITANSSVYFRAASNQTTATAFYGSYYSRSNFSFTTTNGGTVEASGNIMSLYGPSCPNLALSQYAFAYMFYQCTLLTTSPELPATTLASYCYEDMFYGCTALTTAPALPATSLASYCYYSMFYGCTSLTTTPILPATTITQYCYYQMFYGCISLTTIPELPATTLASYCYAYMFEGCTSLKINTTWPGKEWRITATSEPTGAIWHMFYNTDSYFMNSTPSINTTYYIASEISSIPLNFTARNDSVTVAFDIKNTTHTIQYTTDNGTSWNNYTSNTGITLNKDETIYFQADTNQTTATAFGAFTSQNSSKFIFNSTNGGTVEAAGNIMSLYGPDCPNLPLSQYAFKDLFSGCTLLTTPPSLTATTLATSCYEEMFSGCTSIKILPSLPATTLSSGCYYRMFYGCTSLKVDSSFPGRKWKISSTSTATSALTDMFSNTSGTMNGTPSVNTTYYVSSDELSIPLNFTIKNGQVNVSFGIISDMHAIEYSIDNGISWADYSSNTGIALYANETIYFRAKSNQCTANSFYNSGYISRFSFSSSNGGTVEASGNIMSLYGPDCPNLHLNSNAFRDLFMGCTLLTTAPSLPSTYLADYCYQEMFYNCSLLTTPPVLPATDLENYCYESMFQYCSALTTAPELPATSLANYCYKDMFYGCTSLTTPPVLPARILYNSCYEAMFLGCTSLTSPPALPAWYVANECYFEMFSGCTSLNTAPALPALTLADNCYKSMFDGCTSLRIPPELPATNIAESCYQTMFSSCSSLTTIPELPATTLEEYCYNQMFYDCSSLELDTTGPGKPWIIPTRAFPNGSLTYMFYNTAGTMNGTPAVNTTYYIASDPSYKSLVTSAVNDASMGSVSGGGLYVNGTTATLTATANTHYHFVQWSNGATTPTISITVNNDTTLTAIFAIDQHTVTVNSNNTVMGNVSGGGTYNYGDTVTLTATPTAHHHLTNWSNGKTTQTITIIVSGNMTITATFAIDQHQVTANANSSSMGYVSGEGMYNYDTTAILTATAKTNYRFVNWSNGATTPTITITVTCDTTLTAYFESCPQTSEDIYETICQGESFSGHGVTDVVITQDTVLSVVSKMADKCDSTTYIHITCLPNSQTNEYANINEGESYTWHNNTYTKTGDYSDTLISANGCDSIVTLHLDVVGETAVDDADDVVISIVPNPVNAGSTALVYGDFGEVKSVEIINNFGQVITTFSPAGYPITIPAISTPGIYYVRIITTDGRRYLTKLVVI